MIQRREQSAADAERGGDGDAGGGQLDGPGQAGQDFVQDGLPAAHRSAQVEVDQSAQKRGVLHRAGLVEAELMADVVDVGLRWRAGRRPCAQDRPAAGAPS